LPYKPVINAGSRRKTNLDNDVGNIHLAAEGREPDDELDGVNVVGDHDELGLLALDQGGDVVDAVLQNAGLVLGVTLLVLGLLAYNSSVSNPVEAADQRP
jgi:hypothetical protein